MARIRTIKPEIRTSPQFVDCSTTARLLFILLWTMCDDGGRYVASLKRLKMDVFPADDFTTDDVDRLIRELKSAKDENGIPLIDEYAVNGISYWEVTGWSKHQRIEKPNYKYPDRTGRIPGKGSDTRRLVDDSSATGSGIVGDSSTTYLETETETELELNNERTNVATARPSNLDSTTIRRPIDDSSTNSATRAMTNETNAKDSSATMATSAAGEANLDWSLFDWSLVTDACNETVRRLREHARSPQDRTLVIRTNALIYRGVIPQHWLDDSISSFLANRKNVKKSPWAYFQTTLMDIATANGVDLRRLLKTVPVPEKLSAVPARSSTSDEFDDVPITPEEARNLPKLKDMMREAARRPQQ